MATLTSMERWKCTMQIQTAGRLLLPCMPPFMLKDLSAFSKIHPFFQMSNVIKTHHGFELIFF